MNLETGFEAVYAQHDLDGSTELGGRGRRLVDATPAGASTYEVCSIILVRSKLMQMVLGYKVGYSVVLVLPTPTGRGL